MADEEFTGHVFPSWLLSEHGEMFNLMFLDMVYVPPEPMPDKGFCVCVHIHGSEKAAGVTPFRKTRDESIMDLRALAKKLKGLEVLDLNALVGTTQ